jgi:hypothetical protein
MKRLGIARQKLYFIKIFINRAFSVSDEYTQAAEGENPVEEWDDDGDEDAKYEQAVDVLIFYQEIVCRAALGELNSLIEYELKLVAQHIYQSKVRDKKRAISIIQADGLELNNLPGYTGVENVRGIMNSYKHEDGYSGKYRDFAGHYVEIEEKHELQPESILKLIDSVDEFILALYKCYPDVEEDPRLKFNKEAKGT